jgi:transaldolase
MIPTIDQEIIVKLKQGLSPAQISIAYDKTDQKVSASYARHIKDLVDNDMTDMLEEEDDIPADDRIASVATTSRQYEKMMKEAMEYALSANDIGLDDCGDVCLSDDRTEYEVAMNDGSIRIIKSGFAYLED